jgi:hypothetical protein
MGFTKLLKHVSTHAPQIENENEKWRDRLANFLPHAQHATEYQVIAKAIWRHKKINRRASMRTPWGGVTQKLRRNLTV